MVKKGNLYKNFGAFLKHKNLNMKVRLNSNKKTRYF